MPGSLIDQPNALKKTLMALTNEPGIYKMLDDGSNIIYIGKAKSLKKRISSYFNKQHDDAKTTVLVRHIAAIDVIATRSEFEALVLERQLIRQFKPRYNIQLKDDKSYPYIKLTVQEPFPRLLVVRNKLNDGALYFGPYPSIGSSKHYQKFLYQLFPLRDCTKPIDLETKQRKCIQLDIGNCVGPCIYKDIKAHYDELVADATLFLKGDNKHLLKSLETKMMRYSDNQEYEKAAQVRDRITKIKALAFNQLVDIRAEKTVQVWAGAHQEGLGYIIVQQFVEGKLLYQKGFYYERESMLSPSSHDTVANEPTSFQDNQAWIDYVQACFGDSLDDLHDLPALVIGEEVFEQALVPMLAQIPSKKVSFLVPQRGIKKDLLEQAKVNASLGVRRLLKEQYLKLADNPKPLLDSIKKVLGLSVIPERVMGFDISHLQGNNIVGSSVYFKEGQPYKQGYRIFNVRSVSGKSNDPLSIKETVLRRLQLCVKRQEPLPQLLLIDGGRGQLNFAYEAVKEFGDMSIELVSLAKRDEELYQLNKRLPLVLPRSHEVLKFFQRVRDEAHRFALKHQRIKRKKSFASVLSDIPGIGEKRLDKLVAEIGFIEDIYASTPKEIAEKCGFSIDLSQQIYEKVQAQYGH